MTKSLPPAPSLKHLRLEAKNILKAHKAGDASCCGVLRNLHQFKEQPDEEILKAKVGLQEVQFALAMEYGFKGWTEMKVYVKGGIDRNRLDTVSLNGHEYGFRWLDTSNIRELPLVSTKTAPLRTPRQPYGNALDPLYNIQCEMGIREPGDVDSSFDWGEYYTEMAETLPPELGRFALVAYAEDAIAGHVQFLPQSIGRMRHAPAEVNEGRSISILQIGTACVDSLGVEDGLDVELLRRVIAYARARHYSSLQAIGWSDIRIFSLWGESLPFRVYEEAGFEKVLRLEATPVDALQCMLDGNHGDNTLEIVTKEMAEAGLDAEKAGEMYLMEMDMAG